MLGHFNILPMLKGWECGDSFDSTNLNLTRGAAPVSTEIRGLGWLMLIIFITDDCFARLRIFTRSGRGTSLKLMWDNTANGGYLIGAFAQDPAGWIQQYIRPSSTSSAGVYVAAPFTGGYQGSPLPFMDRTIIETSLGPESTQETCMFKYLLQTIKISDVKQFVKSLRAVEGNRNMNVDPALLEYAEQFME